jgi:hypothetical protein
VNLKSLLHRFNGNKEKIKILIPIAIISIIIMIYMIIRTIITVRNLNRESNELYNLKYFNMKLLKNNEYTEDRINDMDTINDIINYELEISKDTNKYNEYLSTLQNPYLYLMRNILLPQINIRKDPFI